jgi:hypothetical protein
MFNKVNIPVRSVLPLKMELIIDHWLLTEHVAFHLLVMFYTARTVWQSSEFRKSCIGAEFTGIG